MKTNNIKIIICSIIILLITESITILPWWGFIVIVILLGIGVGVSGWKISSFTAGFIAGFLVWFLATLYFDLRGNGIILTKVGHLISCPKVLIMLLSGLIGGLLSGLALYTGYDMVTHENDLEAGND